MKGVCPLHGVTEAKRRREGAWPLSGSACEAPKRDFECPPSPPNEAGAESGVLSAELRRVRNGVFPMSYVVSGYQTQH